MNKNTSEHENNRPQSVPLFLIDPHTNFIEDIALYIWQYIININGCTFIFAYNEWQQVTYDDDDNVLKIQLFQQYEQVITVIYHYTISCSNYNNYHHE